MPEPEEDSFTPDERITSPILKSSSISPHSRVAVGIFALVPRAWRGPIIVCLSAVAGYGIARLAPHLIEWMK